MDVFKIYSFYSKSFRFVARSGFVQRQRSEIWIPEVQTWMSVNPSALMTKILRGYALNPTRRMLEQYLVIGLDRLFPHHFHFTVHDHSPSHSTINNNYIQYNVIKQTMKQSVSTNIITFHLLLQIEMNKLRVHPLLSWAYRKLGTHYEVRHYIMCNQHSSGIVNTTGRSLTLNRWGCLVEPDWCGCGDENYVLYIYSCRELNLGRPSRRHELH
jgi:hypothetical protein